MGETRMTREQQCEMAAVLTRRVWESRRADMAKFLIEQKKFNPKAVPKVIDNFIESMVFTAAASGTPMLGGGTK